jgi:GTP-binding protein EngB required for normal cell division
MPGTDTDDSGTLLNESQQRHLRVSCEYIDRLLADIEHVVMASSSQSLFPRHVSTLTPVQKKIIFDYLARIRSRLLSVLDTQHLRPGPPDVPDVFAIRTTLNFVDIAIEELKPKYMRGYGDMPEALVPRVEGIVDELRSIVQKLSQYLSGGSAGDLQARLARLEQGREDVESLTVIEQIVTARGLVEYRPTLTMLVERASSRSFEIAVFGRVSSGKSSLLNYVLDGPVLPVGITPITAVPTRITYGREPLLHASCAGKPDVILSIDHLPELVTEQRNPSNTQHVLRLVVELPARRLREGVVLVDTPGLGSLARGGAEQTMAYLPRCDLGVVLVDASSTLTPDDLLVIEALYEASVPAMVLLSKADLLTGDDERQRAVEYTADQLRKEMHLALTVHPVSVVGDHATLIERWFSSEIEPLYERHREAATISLRRKIAALREAVQASLQARVSRRDASSRPDPAAFTEAEADVRQAAGLFLATSRRCERLAGSLASLGPDVLHQAAQRLAVEGRIARDDSRLVVDAIHASLRDIVGKRVDRIRLEIRELTTASAKAIDRAAFVLGIRAQPLHPDVDDLPQLAFAFIGFTVPHVSWLAFSRALRVWYLERHLRGQLETRLDEALAAHERLLQSWARRAIEATREAFGQQVEPIRAQFEGARRPGTGATSVDDETTLTRDLQELERIGLGHVPRP